MADYSFWREPSAIKCDFCHESVDEHRRGCPKGRNKFEVEYAEEEAYRVKPMWDLGLRPNADETWSCKNCWAVVQPQHAANHQNWHATLWRNLVLGGV